jgi:hypothetical protein
MMDFEQKLDKLFYSFREASPDPEPSASFTPGIWNKIETRRRQSFVVSWTRNLVAASASLCLVFGLFLITPFPNGSHPLATYLDSLDDEHDRETVAELHQIPNQSTVMDAGNSVLVEEE